MKGILEIGNTIKVSYTASASSSGVTSVQVGTVPPDASNPSGAKVLMISPAGSDSHAFKLLDNAEMVRIFVKMPTRGGTGTLTVTENGETKNSEKISADTDWSYSVE